MILFPTKEAIQAERLRRSLSRFSREAWKALYPGKSLIWCDYLTVICDHLEAVFPRRTFRRLLMELPPNTLKSTFLSVFWPSWVWTFEASFRWLYATNEAGLAERDAGAMRDLISSEWYQRTFEPTWRLKADSDRKDWFTNTAGGHRISYSVNSTVTGKKGDALIVDDGNDAKKVRSRAYRNSTNEWFDDAFSGRFADEKLSPTVISGQRLDKDDLIGHVKKKGGYVCLTLSEEFNPESRCQTPIWSDPRSKPGEWLRPERFGPDEKKDAIGRMGSRGYITQHGQRPQDAEGSLFKKSWFQVIETGPAFAVRVRYWDKAHTKDAGCYTAGVLLSRDEKGIWTVEDVVREQESALLREQLILNTTKLDATTYGFVITVVEQEPAGGVESALRTVAMLAGYACHVDPARGSKESRAEALAAQAEVGNVRVLNRKWTAEYLNEIGSFPDSEYADQVDATAGAFNWIAKHGPPIGQTEPVYSPTGESAIDELPSHTFG